MELQEPKLFIQSPPSYFVDVKEIAVEENILFEESTSVYELSRTDKIETIVSNEITEQIETIQNDVVLRQLNYFSQPNNRNRNYVFHLEDGGKVSGKIEELDGINVKIKTSNNVVLIDGNEIKAITISNRLY